MAVVSMKDLLEAGVHFGHHTRRWNPRMKRFIFTERNGIHIIDLQQTIKSLDDGYNRVRDEVAEGGSVLFVGTKKQAQETIATEAQRCGMPFVNNRWLGGTLTNFRTIRSRCDYLQKLEGQIERGELARLPKKEAILLEREVERLNKRLSGIKNMRSLPDIVFIVDTRREDLAVKECQILDIFSMAMVDTNCDPDPINLVVPSNDDAIRAIKLMAGKIADAVIEGRTLRQTRLAEAEAEELEFQGIDTSQRIFTPEDSPLLDDLAEDIEDEFEEK